jgi:hypothetical protein
VLQKAVPRYTAPYLTVLPHTIKIMKAAVNNYSTIFDRYSTSPRYMPRTLFTASGQLGQCLGLSRLEQSTALAAKNKAIVRRMEGTCPVSSEGYMFTAQGSKA